VIGKSISHYTILDRLGEGGMGVVYKAEDTTLKRTVALKFLPHNLSAGGPERKRFLLEAQAASALNHPNVSTIYSIEEAEGESFIAMEFVDGVTVKQRIAEGGFQVPEAIEAALQAAEALREAITEFDRALLLTGRDPGVLAEKAHALAVAGRRDEALRMLGEIESQRTRRYVSPYHIADVHVGLGDHDAALEGLQKAFEDRCREMVLLKVEPRLDRLRSDPRFKKLLEQVGLE